MFSLKVSFMSVSLFLLLWMRDTVSSSQCSALVLIELSWLNYFLTSWSFVSSLSHHRRYCPVGSDKKSILSPPHTPLKIYKCRTRTAMNLKVFKDPLVSLTLAPQRDKRGILGLLLSLDTSYQSWWLRLMISVSAKTRRQNHFYQTTEFSHYSQKAWCPLTDLVFILWAKTLARNIKTLSPLKHLDEAAIKMNTSTTCVCVHVCSFHKPSHWYC